MRTLAVLLLFALPAAAKEVTLKSILLEQLRASHDVEEWYVPVSIAVAGLTPQQAAWTDKSGNHSVGQLANHLLFWNRRQLAKFNGEEPDRFSGNNDETFNAFDEKSWAATVQGLDQVLTAWEKAVEAADEAKLRKWASTIAHIGTHNAYHTGQIVYVRKLQGSWDPEKGVKG